ncbi:MAG TPA: T9SS type A sorting domain-containing protein [Candidatus Coatesbacteria bacterium]|nr:T9SS type A sorting domain-containing protein [Candidatus Coatesbacteria bacterium]
MKKLITVLFVLALFSITSAGEWHIETVDSGGGGGFVGIHTSLALNSSGNPHISYFELVEGSGNLRYAHWDGYSWQIEIVDSEGDVGRHTSIALDTSEFAHISYFDATIYDLKYARWTGSSWQIETVDSDGDVGWFTSLALDSSSYPHIAYHDWGNSSLKYARWDGSSWNIETVDSAGNVGWYTSLALDSSDRPHISNYSSGDGDLKYARWTDSIWQIQTVDLEGDVGLNSSLALDSSGYPHISYYDKTNGDLKYACWDGHEWANQTVDSEGNVGKESSLALDSSGHPHISYYDGTNDSLKYACWDGYSWQIETVDAPSPPDTWETGRYTSLALDSSDNPNISYCDYYLGDLKYAYRGDGPGVEGAEVFANVGDEGVLVGWRITGDIPAALRVLRTAGEGEPKDVFGSLDGVATRWLDRNVVPGESYTYWLEVVEADGTVSRFGPTEAVSIPGETFMLILDAAYPSPAREVVNFAYSLPADGRVVLAVYDLSGRRVATLVDGEQAAGRHEASWNCADTPSGVYLYRLETAAGSLTRRLVVSR